jgi:peptide-methionine (R)-S-oxide reductase
MQASGSNLVVMAYDVDKTETEWKAQLTPAEYRVLREAGTERPGTSSYEHDETVGVYQCRGCGAELFRSEHKFDAHCGWPAFYTPLAEDRVELRSDNTLGMVRTEVRCARCGSHLGHVFSGEGFATPTDERYCINGIALTLQPAESTADRP